MIASSVSAVVMSKLIGSSLLLIIVLGAKAQETVQKNFAMSIYKYDGSEIAALFKCIGTMITFEHVLTMASCVSELEVQNMKLLGESTVESTEIDPPLYNVEELYVYPGLEKLKVVKDLRSEVVILKVSAKISD